MYKAVKRRVSVISSSYTESTVVCLLAGAVHGKQTGGYRGPELKAHSQPQGTQMGVDSQQEEEAAAARGMTHARWIPLRAMTEYKACGGGSGSAAPIVMCVSAEMAPHICRWVALCAVNLKGFRWLLCDGAL